LAFNRRGHDILTTRLSRDAEGGAFQTVAESVADNRYAAQWLTDQGHPQPVIIGHSYGGMLSTQHVADHPQTPALVLLSAGRGGRENVSGGCVHQQYVVGLEILHNHAKALVAAGQQPAMTLRDAEAALAQGKVQLATDEAIRSDVKNQLAVLLGQTPAQFVATHPEAPMLKDFVVWNEVPTGLPATLIDHRPDVQAAETALEAADIQIKVAKKNFLPRITLTGQTGFTSLYGHRWLTLDALSSAITPAINAPLLTGGANKGRLKMAKAQREQALNQYLNAVNTACGEVETALARLQASTHNLGEKTQRQQAIEDKVGRIHARYQVGLDSEPTYWLAALEQLPVQSDAIVERAQVALNTAQLMTALGGGFKRSGTP